MTGPAARAIGIDRGPLRPRAFLTLGRDLVLSVHRVTGAGRPPC